MTALSQAEVGTLNARYGLPVPANPWPGKVARYASVQAFGHCAGRAA